MGGPALHVAYLSSGLADRGYRTTLVAGSLARGEESIPQFSLPSAHIPKPDLSFDFMEAHFFFRVAISDSICFATFSSR